MTEDNRSVDVDVDALVPELERVVKLASDQWRAGVPLRQHPDDDEMLDEQLVEVAATAVLMLAMRHRAREN